MKTVRGDLVVLAEEGGFDVIIHGCNCFHAMDAGIARQIKAVFPEAWDADRATPEGVGKLGGISFAAVTRRNRRLTVVNAYTQADWRGDGVKVDYDALRQAFREVKERFGGLRIGYPKIGAGLAGGDWEKIAAIIDEELAGETHTLVEYH